MRQIWAGFYGCWLVVLLLSGCVDRFEPGVIRSPSNYLVVDGFINLRGRTVIRLTRTLPLADTASPPVETRSSVVIRDEAGGSFSLVERRPGEYVSDSLVLPAGRRYQLYLRTSTGREYASELVESRLTPAIDSVTWRLEGPNLRLAVNAHDATSSTRYYRWSFAETWEYRSGYHSYIEYVNGAMQPRPEDIYVCWRTENPTAIKLSSTQRLSEDVVSDYPLQQFPANSVRLARRYSILVRQYAQTAEEYAYWEQLQKNTESLGGLFDPTPSQLTGNVRCLSEADEPVMGYVGAVAPAEKRIFISQTDLPPTRFDSYYAACTEPDTLLLAEVPNFVNSPNLLPVYPLYYPMSSIIFGYAIAPRECVDCRIWGANRKPDFWP